MTFNALVIATLFMLVLTCGDWLADDLESRHGRIKWRRVWRAALLIGPTVIVALHDWKVAAVGWAMRIVLGYAMKLFFARIYTPKDPKQLPVEELERALATGLTGEALANDIAARRVAHEAKFGVSTKS